jgi:OOP family OmpA-OmpF porin
MLNKKIVGVVAVALSSLAVSSFAASQGPYVGAQLGYGKVQQSSDSFTTSFPFNVKNTGVAGRVFAGYQVNENFAGELGWTRFTNVNGKGSATVLTPATLFPVPTFTTTTVVSNGYIQNNAIDLVAKGIYAVTDKVKVYGKLGAAYVMSRETVNTTFTTNNVVVKSKATQSESKILPTAGVGVSYDFTNNVAADVSYTRIQKVGKTNLVSSSDFFGAGLTYSFG